MKGLICRKSQKKTVKSNLVLAVYKLVKEYYDDT